MLWFSVFMGWCALCVGLLRGEVVMNLRLHPPSKQYCFGVLIKRIIESAELAVCWAKAQKEEIHNAHVLIHKALFFLSF